jgi:hypothetical protein
MSLFRDVKERIEGLSRTNGFAEGGSGTSAVAWVADMLSVGVSSGSSAKCVCARRVAVLTGIGAAGFGLPAPRLSGRD